MRRAILIAAAALAVPTLGTPAVAQRGILGTVRRAAQGAAVGSFAIGVDKEREILTIPPRK